MEKVKNSVGSVDGTQGSSDPSPFTITVVWNGWVVVLQPSVKNQPGIHEKVRIEVPEKNRHETVLHRGVRQSTQRCNNTGSRQENLERNLLWEHRGRRAKVIGDTSIQGFSFLVHFSSGCQTHEVQWPANCQMRPDLEGSKDTITPSFMPRRIEAIALIVWSKTIVNSGGGDVRFAIGQMVCTTVVLRMSVLPGKVGNKQSLVHNESNDVIPSLRRRESTVSTFVGNHPRAGQDGSHPEGVETPSKSPGSDRQRIHQVGKVGGKHFARCIKESSSDGTVTKEVVHTPYVRPLKTMLGNTRLDLSFGGEFWRILVQRIVRRLPLDFISLLQPCVGSSSLAHFVLLVCVCFEFV